VRILALVLVLGLIAACHSKKVVGWGEDCTVDWGFTEVECEEGFTCDQRTGCQPDLWHPQGGTGGTLPPSRPFPSEGGAGDGGHAEDAGEDESDSCSPGSIDTTTAGCPTPDTARHRECTDAGTWTNFSSTCD
jgi:hypothetical protein